MKNFALVATLFALTTVSAQADMSCVGTEPFWGLKISEKSIRFSSPDVLDGVQLKIKSKKEAAGMVEGFATVIKTKHTSLTMVRGECSDGMSDATYSHHAVYEMKGTVYYGCCSASE